MKELLLLLLAFGIAGCQTAVPSKSESQLERVVVAPDQSGFLLAQSGRPFVPWGMNYGNAGRLMEDFWDEEWETFAEDFRELKALGANVVRVHLQFGKFMNSPVEPNPVALKQYERMVRLAEETGIYLNVTGLASYRPSDTPAWYDAMDEEARWNSQAIFWGAIARASARSAAIFCYDLINEPVAPAKKRDSGAWRSGHLFGGYDFVQSIALDPAGRKREEIAMAWIRQLTAAIREHDKETLITVGLLPWSRQWKHLSGFLPEKIAPELDFLSVHIYPDSKQLDEAMEGLKKFSVGKPVVIEETFPLICSVAELETFLRESRTMASGWFGHYDGLTLEESNVRLASGKLTLPQSIYRAWLQLFVRLKPEFAPDSPSLGK